jgi:hypothetical protein
MRWVASWVAALGPADEIRTGMADGVDTVAALISMRTLPTARHTLYQPHARHNAQLPTRLPDNIEIVACPDGPEPYRIRNRMMVEGADELIAFVRSHTFYRSGEWMTINLAKAHRVRIEMALIPYA